MSSDSVAAAPACARSRLSPQARLAITFAVLFTLKYALPHTPLPMAAQTVVLVAVATWFAWRFWWRCSADHRGFYLLTGALWIAGIIKIALHS